MTIERIDIVVPDKILAENPAKQRRLEEANKLGGKPDRVPVIAGDSQYLLLAARGSTFGQYTRSPQDNLREQILNRKWRIENIRDDTLVPTKGLSIRPDFGVLRATEFPMEIIWQEDGPPKCVHPLHDVEDIDRLTIPPPDGALHVRYIEWYRAMQQAAENLDVRINGQKLKIEATMSHGGGPIPAAFALCGENLFMWMLEDPVRIHRLMDIVTQSHINCFLYFDRLCGRSEKHPIWMGCDTAEMLSPQMFSEFVVPYYRRVWEVFPGPPRSFHMCGKIDHLLTIIRDEMKITKLDGFGCVTDRHKLAEVMSGRIILQGGPEPLLISTGTREAVVRECRSYIDLMGRSGGYILAPGGGPVPGTPPEHFSWMVEAAVEAAG